MDTVTVAILVGVACFWIGFFWNELWSRGTATSGNAHRPRKTRPINLSTLQEGLTQGGRKKPPTVDRPANSNPPPQKKRLPC